MHEFLIEADVTTEEWMDACNLLIAAGKVSSDKRNEMVLVTDVFGIESLVTTLDQTRPERLAAVGKLEEARKTPATFSAILGPFYRYGVPVQPNGTSIIRQDEPGAPYTHLSGIIYGPDGKPVPNALVDIWHDAPDGLYDAQSPEKPEYHCRGRFRTNENGRYETYCLRPVPYPIPFDHQAGQLLKIMDRHPYRPAHIHVGPFAHTVTPGDADDPFSSGSRLPAAARWSRRSLTRSPTTSRTTRCSPSKTTWWSSSNPSPRISSRPLSLRASCSTSWSRISTFSRTSERAGDWRHILPEASRLEGLLF
jgi:protocatechuate 3,4-dioxygenase beta subunit